MMIILYKLTTIECERYLSRTLNNHIFLLFYIFRFVYIIHFLFEKKLRIFVQIDAFLFVFQK